MKCGIYQRTSGKYYQVLGVSRHSEILDEFVVYQALYDDFGLWIRPLSMFQEKVRVEGAETPRFTFIAENLIKAPKID